MKLKKVNIIPLVEVINLINKIDWISRARKNWEREGEGGNVVGLNYVLSIYKIHCK